MKTTTTLRDRRAIGAVLLVLVTLASACGDDSNRVNVELRRGEQRAVELTVTTTQIFDGRLLSCDFVSLRPKDPDNQLALQNLEIALSDSGKSGDLSCTARIDLAVHADAVPGEYRIDVDFSYTWTDGLDILTGEDQGRIRITIVA
ncbi:MAG: hypothetical protein U0610_15815 [bacterium]